MSVPTIYIPLDTIRDPFFRHAGDTFRELAHMWEEHGLVEVMYTQNVHVWIGEEETDEGVLLYDRPTMEWWQRRTPSKYKCALFGNQQPPPGTIPRAFPWTFWGRRPKMLEQYASSAPLNRWDARPIKSIFLGKVENQVQNAFRNEGSAAAAGFKEVIEEFALVVGKNTPYPYTQSQYLERIHQSRYGLCLRGYGPKCNREIELMALGTVPLVTPHVDMQGYFDQPKEGVHFLRVATPEDVRRVIADTTQQQWEQLSHNCRDWYLRNCSAVGSFYQTMRLVRTLSTSTLVSKPMSTAWSVPQPKLAGVKRVVIDTVFFERAFSGISRVWMGLLQQLIGARAEMLHQHHIEIVLLYRAGAAVLAQSPGMLQAFAFVGIPSFTYDRAAQEVTHLDGVCRELQADLFISTYYTYCNRDATTHGCLAVVHDMIPEHFKMPKNAMWHQKDACLANASAYWCISEHTRSQLVKHCSTAAAAEGKLSLVCNSFDPRIFEGVDEQLADGDSARDELLSSLGVALPFVLVVSSNSEAYKNYRLVSDMVRMQPNYFAHVGVVVLCNNKLPSIEGTRLHVLHGVSDRHLGLLYGLASALVYPSKMEGFGLPALEAFWSECPVVCCTGSGAIPEVAGDAAFYVPPNDPAKLFEVVEAIVAGKRDAEVKEKAARGLELVQSRYTPQTQLRQFIDCLYSAMDMGEPPATELTEPPTSTVVAEKKQPKDLTRVSKTKMEEEKTTTPNTASAANTAANTVTVPVTEPTTTEEERIHLILQYFVGDNEERQAEYDFCVQANLANAKVERVYCMLETELAEAKLPDWLATHEKVTLVDGSGRLTYKQAFDYANDNLSGKIVALCNLDIFLDHNSDWNSAKGLFDMSIVLCLSRHEFNGVDESTKDPQLQRLAFANTQDCWVFRAPIFVKDCDFSLGKLGCDNAIAHRLNASGYIPVNSPNEFKVHHYDLCRGKGGANYLQHHTPNPERPEDRGCMLVPDYGALPRVTVDRVVKDPTTGEQKRESEDVISVDQLITNMGLGNMHRYREACDVMSRYIAVNNPK